YAGEQGWGDIQEVMATSLRSAGERILVADRSGMIVADTDRQWLGRQIQETGLSGGVVITASGEAVGELYLLVSGRQGMGMGHMGGAGAHMMPMMLGAEEDFLDRVNDSLWQAGLIAAGVALLVGLVLTRQITRPIRGLIMGVRHIAGGELGYRVPVRSRDEIGELSDSFNAMASSLEKGEQSRRQLTADIAHELRTPLTVIEGTVDGMLDGVFQANPEHLLSIKEQVSLLTGLIGDLRDLSLAESGQMKLNLAPTDLASLVRRLVSRYEIKAGEKGVQLKTGEAGSVPEVNADPARMEQVIANLLTNAIRHTPAGGSITATVAEIKEGIEITVADTGEGITPADLPLIFERFYRSGSSRSRKEGGTGLGLAIVKQMVEAHHGRVWAESEPGKGSIFHVLLPSS
ncbi:MAG: ATP-binding protein, partial [Dehalococcoidales bacterium]|nr:ATP-binding protein [Dehalococcoidales bacterium]